MQQDFGISPNKNRSSGRITPNNRVITVYPRPHAWQQKRSTVKITGFPRRSNKQISLRAKARPAVLNKDSSKTKSFTPTFLVSLAIILFVGGTLLAVNAFKTNRTVQAQVKQSSESDDSSTPDMPSETPTDPTSYKVAPALPRMLKIEKAGVSARVMPLGVNADSSIKSPKNTNDVGWYEASAKPGEKGTVVLDGHVSGPTKGGVFVNIKNLKKGDKISLERGDGKEFVYSVTNTEIYEKDKVDMAKVLTTEGGRAGLNMITCNGNYNSKTKSYDKRLIVFAVQD